MADAEGLAALSMRRVADALGVAPMSLYTYVPSKAELIDVMLDAVYGELARPEPEAGGWRARLAFAARVGAAAGAAYGSAYSPEHAFEFGLQRVLDGIETFIQARSAQLTRR